MIPRRKIRAHNSDVVASIPNSPFDPSRTNEISRTIDKAYSGYVHAASPQIMELYGGNPPHFHMSGMLGTPVEQAHRQDFCNYVYRSICVFGLVRRHSAIMSSGAKYANMQAVRTIVSERLLSPVVCPCAPQKVDPALFARFRPATIGCSVPVDPTKPPASYERGEARSCDFVIRRGRFVVQ